MHHPAPIMDFPDNNDLKLALEKAEAQARLANADTPTRLCEDWRYGRPHKYASQLVELLGNRQITSRGSIRIQAPEGVAEEMMPELKENEILMQTIGSDRILALHLERFERGVSIFIEESIDEPIIITYETEDLFTPTTCIMAEPGVKARIIERHITHGAGTMVCTRCIQAAEGAELSIELEECGSGASRVMNITNITAMDAVVKHLTRHEGHLWAREETLAEIPYSSGRADIHLFSANRLKGHEVLDQHTRQIHHCGNSASNLLYKNVVDGNATAIFAGNIYVAAGAHHTDAYQTNRNMLLSEDATIHSLPGLEILADKVKCSHGSASSPMDKEQLFYLLSRGIPKHEAQLLVAEGFLADAISRYRE